MKYPVFDRSRLKLLPLTERAHDLDLSVLLPLEPQPVRFEALRSAAEHIVAAKERGAARVLMMGGHVIRSGVQRYLIDLMTTGGISCIATNGAGVVHDFEFALIGHTTESVARYIQEGQFGLWRETGKINDIVRQAAAENMGLGEAIGKCIEEGSFPHRKTSIFAAAFRLGIPVTVHVGIGYDIVHQHPNCDGAAWGQTSYMDFLRFAGVLSFLEGGIVMNFGSAVMAPEVYLKALAMVRNLARQDGREIRRFATLVCDLYPMPTEIETEPAKQSHPYYFRPWKTMLVRTVKGDGSRYYVCGPHRETIPQLWTALGQSLSGQGPGSASKR